MGLKSVFITQATCITALAALVGCSNTQHISAEFARLPSPTVTLSSMPAMVRGDYDYQVSFTASRASQLGVDQIVIEYSEDGVSFTPVTKLPAEASRFTWRSPKKDVSKAWLRVVAKDLRANSGFETSNEFEIRDRAPQLTQERSAPEHAASFEFGGQCEPGLTIQVSKDGMSQFSLACPTGKWTFQAAAETDGLSKYSFAQTDPVGHRTEVLATLVGPLTPLTITSITPPKSGESGGLSIEVLGTGFINGAVVRIGGASATDLQFISKSKLLAIVPPGAAGPTQLSVTNPNGIIASAPFTYQAKPMIISVNPATVSTRGTTAIEILGANFLPTCTLLIGGVATPVTFVNPGKLTAMAPARGSPGIVPLAVNNGNGDSAQANITYVAPPNLQSVSPSRGPLAGGTQITLVGSGFLSVAEVKLGSQSCLNTVIVDSSHITCTTLVATAAATVGVTVDNKNGDVSAPGTFTYIAPPTIATVTPSSGPLIGGNSAVITGSGFLQGLSVSFGGVSATVTSLTSTQITVTVPGATVPGAVSVGVVNPSSLGNATLNVGYTYLARPAITSISPSSGPLPGGTLITIAGSGFLPASRVNLGGKLATQITFVSSTQLTAVTPPGDLPIQVGVVVDNLNGDTATGSFTYTDPNTIVITPSQAMVPVNTIKVFEFSGGDGNYVASLSGVGQLFTGTNSSRVSFQSSVMGTAVLRVDSGGSFRTANITVYQPLAISPSAKSLAPGETASFSAAGGVPPYSYSLIAQGVNSSVFGSLSGTSYQAPTSPSTAETRVLVRVQDSSVPPQMSEALVTTYLPGFVLDASWNHTCGMIGGALKCWGLNTSKQLGTDATTSRCGSSDCVPRPVAVQGLGSSRIQALSLFDYPLNMSFAGSSIAGPGTSCAMMADNGGTMQCWGNNFSGQTGRGQSSPESMQFPDWVRVPNGAFLSGVVHPAGTMGLAMTIAGGKIQAWGQQNQSPWARPFEQPKFYHEMQDMAAGRFAFGGGHHCLLNDGGVICWGHSNSYGQVGNGTTQMVTLWAIYPTPENPNQLVGGPTTLVGPLPVPGLSHGVIKVVLGTTSSCALSVDNTVKCWGNQEEGQLGNGMSAGFSVAPQLVQGLAGETVLDITAGKDFYCALLASNNGSLKCWGRSPADGTSVLTATSPNSTSSSSVRMVRAGAGHVCVMKSNQDLYCWGDNSIGQLGIGTSPSQSSLPVLVQ